MSINCDVAQTVSYSKYELDRIHRKWFKLFANSLEFDIDANHWFYSQYSFIKQKIINQENNIKIFSQRTHDTLPIIHESIPLEIILKNNYQPDEYIFGIGLFDGYKLRFDYDILYNCGIATILGYNIYLVRNEFKYYRQLVLVPLLLFLLYFICHSMYLEHGYRLKNIFKYDVNYT